MLELLVSAVTAFFLLSGQSPSAPPAIPSAAEFPPSDLRLSMVVREGATSKLAAQRLRDEPGSPDTIRVLIQARDFDGVLSVLRRVVDGHPERIPAAFDALGPSSWQFRGDEAAARQRAEMLTQIVADARRRLNELPREEAARVARLFVNLDGELNPGSRQQWPARLAQFREEYAGTEEALLAEVDQIASAPVSQRTFEALDAVIRSRPNTTIAAKALYQKGFQWHTINTLGRLEPRGADPIHRFLRVVGIVEELESGRYPPSEWVSKASSLITGFFVPQDAKIPPESLDRIIAVLENRVRMELARNPHPLDDEHPGASGVGYVIISKLADLYAKEGDRFRGVERLLSSLEETVAETSPLAYLRALLYMRLIGRETAEERAALLEKARIVLLAAGNAGDGQYNRKALATLANLDVQRGDYRGARAAYYQFARSYPTSDFAWVALLRAGRCEEELGDLKAAVLAYSRATAAYAHVPIAVVLGHEYAARALEADGDFAAALAEHEHALTAWDNAYGLRYSTYMPQPVLLPNPFEPRADPGEVSKESLAPRIAALRKTLSAPGGADLERGRALLSRGRLTEARTVLDDVAARFRGSPAASEARTLASRARLEWALQLAAVERPDADEAAAIRELEALAKEPLDFAVIAARIARASIFLTHGDRSSAEKWMADALTAWHAAQHTSAPAVGLETDVAEIRRVVFLPRGGDIYASDNWDNYKWPSSSFSLVNSDVLVKPHQGDPQRISLKQDFAVDSSVIYFDTTQIALLKEMITRLGGTGRRDPVHIMETPNQPIGASREILAFWNAFFPTRPGHWGGWEIETYPVVTEIAFHDAARTKASAKVTIGYTGATVELEKEDGRWTVKRMTGKWIM